MLQPARRKYRKEHKGRNRGIATRGNKVSFGEFGLKATTRGRLTARQIDRVILTVRGDPEDAQLLEAVKSAIERHTGTTPVYLSFPSDEGEPRLVRCGGRYKLRVTEDAIEALAQVLGRENVLVR